MKRTFQVKIQTLEELRRLDDAIDLAGVPVLDYLILGKVDYVYVISVKDTNYTRVLSEPVHGIEEVTLDELECQPTFLYNEIY